MQMRRIVLMLLFCAASCQTLSAPTPLPTATLSPSMTPTSTAVPPTATATAIDIPTATPTITPSPTITLTPTITPQPTTGFVYDNWKLADLPENILDTLKSPVIAFINQNDKDAIPNNGTPQPATGLETLYYVSPTNSASRIAVMQLPASTDNHVYISPNGKSVAYFLEASGTEPGGLYILDLESRIAGRILPLTSLIQRGLFSQPVWSPDGTRLAIAVSTGYDMDIFVIDHDGTNLRNVTQNGSYDFWPAWSPDGTHLAFVSDRVHCPSWIPGDPNACDAVTTSPPNGGNIFILDVNSGAVQQLSDQWVTETGVPRWLTTSKVVFASGDPALGDPERTLWIGDVNTMQAHEVHLADGSDSAIRLSESWARDGSAVIYQSVTNTTSEIIGVKADGTLIGRTSELNFPRFGMSASWAVDSSRIAIGGVNGQCQYGIRVMDGSMKFITRGTPPPSMCDPSYSPDGNSLVFTGVNPAVDGRVDIYVANTSGFGSVNLTGTLKGVISLLGWVGGQS
jgi:Tol biopolymer transport system component